MKFKKLTDVLLAGSALAATEFLVTGVLPASAHVGDDKHFHFAEDWPFLALPFVIIVLCVFAMVWSFVDAHREFFHLDDDHHFIGGKDKLNGPT